MSDPTFPGFPIRLVCGPLFRLRCPTAPPSGQGSLESRIKARINCFCRRRPLSQSRFRPRHSYNLPSAHLPEADPFRYCRAFLRIAWGRQRVVRPQTPSGAIFVAGQPVVGADVPAQSRPSSAAFQAIQSLVGDRSADWNDWISRLLQLGRGSDLPQSLMHRGY
jgi:hypothetical protein